MAKPAVLLPLLLFVLSATLALSCNPKLQHCKDECQRQMPIQVVERCMSKCERRYGHGGRNNPFVLDKDDFFTALETQEGRLRVAPKFTEMSRLHCGIQNHRVAIFEANPKTMLLPAHTDADVFFFVAEGKAIVTTLRNENKESYNLRRGDILRILAGSTVYIINSDSNRKLRILKLFRTVSVPGRFEEFFGVGSENPESFFLKFSRETVESAFNASFDSVRRTFGGNQESIKSVAEERIREVAKRATSSRGGSRPSGGQSRGPFNIFDERPVCANQYGKLHVVDPRDYDQLRDANLAISHLTVRHRSMMLLNYNAKATKVAVVIQGRGRLEMVSPHVSDPRGLEQSITYERLSAQISRGYLFIVPAGTPYVLHAEQGEDLQVVCFDINGEDNQKIFLAGGNNVWSQFSDTEMEIVFNRPAKEVRSLLESQQEVGFVEVREPRDSEGGSRGLHALESILDFAGF